MQSAPKVCPTDSDNQQQLPQQFEILK
uniref:Uncharacterized protein n=1 Tax=Arundo donax TaxID=35708 RepID=A0A0A9BNL2_ARUDO